MVLHGKLHFRSLRRQPSKERKDMKDKVDSPTLPSPPAVPSLPADELSPSLTSAMEKNDIPGHLRPLTDDHGRGEITSGFFNLHPPSMSPTMQPDRLEDTVKKLFSADHFNHILADQSLLEQFSSFVNKFQPQYVPTLIRFMDMRKAEKAIEYANAITRQMVWMDRSESYRLSLCPAATMDTRWRESMSQDHQTLTNEVLPAFVTSNLVGTVVDCVSRDITGNIVPAIADLVGSLAEVFCLTDPSMKDNPIIYASEEFYHTTQYGMSYALNRNCRFLQGPETDQNCVARLGQAIREGRESCETILNYRRDGTPFVNLLMMAPLMDDVGKVKYYIGCQVDVTGLVEQGKGIKSFRSLLKRGAEASDDGFSLRKPSLTVDTNLSKPLQVLQELSEMFSRDEAEVVKHNVRDSNRSDRSMVDSKFAQSKDDLTIHGPGGATVRRPRRVIAAELSDHDPSMTHIASQMSPGGPNGSKPSVYSNVPALPGIYKHYLLVRPYPSCQIVFLSPSFRIPGLLRSNFLEKVGGPDYTVSSLKSAFRDGVSVTAKILWLPKANSNIEARPRWIRCSPLVGCDGRIGVWMIIVVPIENQNPDFLDPPYTKEDRSSSRHSRMSVRSSIISRSRSVEDAERNQQKPPPPIRTESTPIRNESTPIRTASIINMRKLIDGQGIAVRVPSGNGLYASPTSSIAGDRDLYADYMKHPSRGVLPAPPSKSSPPPGSPGVTADGGSRTASFTSQSQRL